MKLPLDHNIACKQYLNTSNAILRLISTICSQSGNYLYASGPNAAVFTEYLQL